jgi:hypothetical protein
MWATVGKEVLRLCLVKAALTRKGEGTCPGLIFIDNVSLIFFISPWYMSAVRRTILCLGSILQSAPKSRNCENHQSVE